MNPAPGWLNAASDATILIFHKARSRANRPSPDHNPNRDRTMKRRGDVHLDAQLKKDSI